MILTAFGKTAELEQHLSDLANDPRHRDRLGPDTCDVIMAALATIRVQSASLDYYDRQSGEIKG